MKNQDKVAFGSDKGLGLTKLEYFSIHCLQGFLSNNFNISIEDSVKKSLVATKELLK